jgi:DNA integrity scanning protein DisA with diadenylate cyclase activity
MLVVAEENAVDAEQFLELPLDFEDVRDRIQFGTEGGMDQEYLDEGDTIACVVSMFAADLDCVTRVRVSESIRTGIYDLFVNSRAEAAVIRDVLELVIELGKKGQKGEPVGALFVAGDAGKVMNKSRPLSYNPFEKSHVHVGDSIVTVMLKEFSRLDGAFVISDSGKIASAYRYLEASAEGIDIPKGLGTRHMAAAAVSRDTNAVAIVLSESDGMVRAFKGGELVLELDPEVY